MSNLHTRQGNISPSRSQCRKYIYPGNTCLMHIRHRPCICRTRIRNTSPWMRQYQRYICPCNTFPMHIPRSVRTSHTQIRNTSPSIRQSQVHTCPAYTCRTDTRCCLHIVRIRRVWGSIWKWTCVSSTHTCCSSICV